MSTTSSHTPNTVSLADEEAVRRVLIDTLFGLWATVNNLTRVAARVLSRDGVRVRANRAGALGLRRGQADVLGPKRHELRHHHGRRTGQSIGIRVHLPFEQDVNPFIEQAFEHATFFTRLHHFVLMSDAYSKLRCACTSAGGPERTP
jgi:hypothetical protein